jgi:competence protein ComEA
MSDSKLPPGLTASASETDAAAKHDDSLSVPAPSSETDARAVEFAPLWLRRTDQIVVATLLVALVVLLTIHWLRLSRWGTAEIELTSQQPREYFYSLDINSASWVEWAQLDGIGEKLAKRIVADREERGPFRDATDVGRVRGIHARQLESMKPFLRGGTATEVASP